MYKIVGCTSCGQLQVTAASKTFLCKYCGRSCELVKARVVFKSADPDEVLAVVQELKMQAGGIVQK